MPSLGVPVKFREINTVSVLCEIVEMNVNLIPDVSLGTHFFNDIVEFKLLYLALFPHRGEDVLNRPLLESMSNRLFDLSPGDSKWSDAVKVIDARDMPPGKVLFINANTLTQRARCYIADARSTGVHQADLAH
mgnify:FL=1